MADQVFSYINIFLKNISTYHCNYNYQKIKINFEICSIFLYINQLEQYFSIFLFLLNVSNIVFNFDVSICKIGLCI